MAINSLLKNNASGGKVWTPNASQAATVAVTPTKSHPLHKYKTMQVAGAIVLLAGIAFSLVFHHSVYVAWFATETIKKTSTIFVYTNTTGENMDKVGTDGFIGIVALFLVSFGIGLFAAGFFKITALSFFFSFALVILGTIAGIVLNPTVGLDTAGHDWIISNTSKDVLLPKNLDLETSYSTVIHDFKGEHSWMFTSNHTKNGTILTLKKES